MNLFKNFIRTFAALFLFIWTSADSASASEQTQKFYRFHPNVDFSLGGGISENLLNRPKLPCISFKKISAKTVSYSPNTEIFVIRDFNELMNALEYDSRIEAHALSESSSSFIANKSLFPESLFSKNSVTIAIRGQVDFGKTTLETPVLQPFAQKLIDEGNFVEFERNCGSRLVTEEHRGSMVTIFVTLTNLNSDEKSAFEIETIFEDDDKNRNNKIDRLAKAKIEEVMTARKNVDSISVRSFLRGLPKTGNTDDLNAKIMSYVQNGFSQIDETVIKITDTATFEKSATTGYTTEEMPFGFKKIGQTWTLEHQSGLEEIADVYKLLSAKLSIFNSILSGIHPRAQKQNPEFLVEIRESTPKIRSYLTALKDQHRRCQDELKVEFCRLPSEAKPKIPDLDSALDNPNQIPRIKFLSTPTLPDALKNDLEIEGDELYGISVTMNGVSVNVKPQRTSGITLIPLGTYWTRLNGMFSGRVVGKIDFKDRFGVRHSRVFHVCQFSAITNERVTNEFSREANLGK